MRKALPRAGALVGVVVVAVVGAQALAASAQASPTPIITSGVHAAATGTPQALPCDVAADAGTPCSAAHSVTRLLIAGYSGPLFQIQRASDSTKKDVFPYTISTLQPGASKTLVGTADTTSVNAFCAGTSCTVTYLYDQVDRVAALKGTWGNIDATFTVTSTNNGAAANGTLKLTPPSGKPVSVTVVNGFASVPVPGSSTPLKVQVNHPFVNYKAIPKLPATVNLTIGNDMPALNGSQPVGNTKSFVYPKLGSMTTAAGIQAPSIDIVGGNAFRQRIGTVDQAIGDSDIGEYMVSGTQYAAASTCCGTYGNMEDNADNVYQSSVMPQKQGMMFALAFSSGAWATDGYGPGYVPGGSLYKDWVGNGGGATSKVNWSGVDVEAGVWLYGPQRPSSERFTTTLAKYSPASASNLFSVAGGNAETPQLTTYVNQAPPPSKSYGVSDNRPFHGVWEGGLSLGEGGDASIAPIQFFEGAILSKVTTLATDNAMQASIASYYGPSANPDVESAYANNLVNQPLKLADPANWSRNATSAAGAVDSTGTSINAATLTGAGSQYANVNQWIKLNVGAKYTFTDYVKATSTATVFPGGSVQTDDTAKTEFAWVLNTNTGAITKGTWGAGTATNLTATSTGTGWWKVTMSFTPPSGSANAHIFLDPPIANDSGTRSDQKAGLTATHYAPGMALQ